LKFENSKIDEFKIKLSKHLKNIGLQKKRSEDDGEYYYLGICEKKNLNLFEIINEREQKLII
jgi:arginine repressor